MPKSTKAYVDKHVLISADLPVETDTYTVISHEYIINTTLQNLADAGFTVLEEKYRCNQAAQVATGIYNIEYGNDPDLSMVFAWTNSYDKSTRFRCAIGANVVSSGASMVAKTSAWTRKHTGAALNETTETIQAIISEADEYFNELVDIKNKMKHVTISAEAADTAEKMKDFLDAADKYKDAAEEDHATEAMDNANALSKLFAEESKKGFGRIMGDLYFTKRLLNGDQASICMRESDNPSFHYGTDVNNLWTAYNYILCSLKITHPKLWMDTQMSVLLHFMDEYDLVNFDVEVEDNTDSIEEKVVNELPENNSMHAEDLDNTEDVEEEVVNEDNADEVVATLTPVIPEPKEPGIFFFADDYPDADIGSFIQVDDVIYTVIDKVTSDGDDYWEVKVYDPEAEIEGSSLEAEEAEETTIEDMSVELPDSPVNTETEETNDETEIEEDVVPNDTFDLPTEEEEDSNKSDLPLPLFTVIKTELQDLYGAVVDFKVDRKDDQYNITLDNGETVVLSTSYIDALLEE